MNRLSESNSDSDNGDVGEYHHSDEEGGIRLGDIYIPPPPKPICSVENTGPRLIITNITNLNFKSYAGECDLGPFHKCFTAIIGPNGSGKSNIIDSMLFVFGYRASKIRSKKISVLIHNSTKYSNINSCTVQVHFQQIIDKDDEDSYDVVPNSQFVISRTAFKDNSSYYTIDKKRVQFKEVAKLLRSHGIDLDHNRFLILQGEVEQIAMMKPKGATEHETGMLEFLEDIIGTSRFKEPLQKIIQLGNDLNQERSEKLNRVKMVEKEKDALEEPKNEALKYLKLKNEYTKMLNIDYQLGIHETEQKILEKEMSRKSLDDSMAEMKADLRRIAQEKNEIQKADNELKKIIAAESLQKEEMNAKFDEKTSLDTNLQEETKMIARKRKRTKEMLAEEKKKLLELEKVPEKNESEIRELSRNEEKLSNQREVEEAALKQTMDGLKAETQELQDQKTSLQTRLIELNVTKNATKSQFDIISSELDIYIQNEQKEKTKMEQIQNNLDNTIRRLAECREGQLDLQSRIPALKEEMQAARARLVMVKKEEAEVGAELQNCCRQVEEARSSMRATKSQGAVVDFLMAEKQSGRLPGIFGRLGDLGAIDQRYDVAVSTACGALDNIVVDTVTTAEHCIECLRRNDVGRATFIALEKQERWRPYCNQKIQTPENVPRLFDLIQVQDEQLKTAFYFALRDTLVAQDLEQATRIAYGAERHRVVTLGGELIELSGTMSGGGNRVLKGKMGQRVVSQSPASVKEVERMERRIETLQQRHQQLQQEHTALEEQISTLAPQLQRMNTDLNKFNIDLQTQEAHEPVLKEQLKKQKEKLLAAAPDPVQLNNKQANVDKARRSYECAAAAAEEVDKEVQKLHKQIMEITEGRMKAAQKKLDVVNKKIDKTRQDATRLKVAIKTADRNAKKSQDKIANMEEEIHTAETNIISLRKQTEQIEQETKKILDLFNIACDKIKEHNAKQMDLKTKLDKLDQEEGKIKLEKLEFDHKLEALETHIKGIKSKQTNLKKSLNQLEMEEIPGETSSMELCKLTKEQLDQMDFKQHQYETGLKETELASTEKPNLAVIKEYKEKSSVYLARVTELMNVTARRNEVRKLHNLCCEKRATEFLGGFKIITSKLKEMYQMITLGGDAELELVDTLDPFHEGIVFSVRPPKKTWKNIVNLSGGERTLSSLALVFALHYYKPTPLYVMDEIDAALDFKNVSIVGNYIKQRTKNAQFIIISLRSNMFELADRLVGIYKTHDCTRCATINPKLYGLDNLELQKKDIGDARERARKRPFSPSQHITSQDMMSSSTRDSNVNVQAVVTSLNPEVQNRTSPSILSPCGIVRTPLNEDIGSLEQADNSSDVSMEEESV